MRCNDPKNLRYSIIRNLILGLFCLLFSFCTPKLIRGTLIEDTPMNRSVMDVVRSYQLALERRDGEALVSLCSKKYFEDNGNSDPDDDYGYDHLKDKIVPKVFKTISDLQIDLEVKEIKIEKEVAYADVRFFYKARMALPAGEKWNADAEINRIELVKENNQWKIISGL